MVDEMNREATDYFISLTHDAYQKNCGDRIGTTITGIFTDDNSIERIPFSNEVALLHLIAMLEIE